MQGGKCAYCGCHFSRTARNRGATFEHVVPKSKGGSNKLSNGLAVCKACNGAKADKDPTEDQLRILEKVFEPASDLGDTIKVDRDRKLEEAKRSGWPKNRQTRP